MLDKALLHPLLRAGLAVTRGDSGKAERSQTQNGSCRLGCHQGPKAHGLIHFPPCFLLRKKVSVGGDNAVFLGQIHRVVVPSFFSYQNHFAAEIRKGRIHALGMQLWPCVEHCSLMGDALE